MSAATKNRLTESRDGARLNDPVAATEVIYSGTMVGLDASGNAVPAAIAVPVMRGVAQAQADNSAGAAGDTRIETRPGTFHFANDDLTRAHIGDNVFVLDDQTVKSTGTLIAGKLVDLDAGGAWVKIG